MNKCQANMNPISHWQALFQALLPAFRPLSWPSLTRVLLLLPTGHKDTSTKPPKRTRDSIPHHWVPLAVPGTRPGNGMFFPQEPRRAAATPGLALGAKKAPQVVPSCLLASRQTPLSHLTKQGPWGQAACLSQQHHCFLPSKPCLPSVGTTKR